MIALPHPTSATGARGPSVPPRRTPGPIAWLFLAILLGLPQTTLAHPFLQNRWQVVATSNRLAMRATVTLREVGVIQGLPPTHFQQPAALIGALSNHAAYVASHLHVRAGGTRLPIEVLDYTLLVDEDSQAQDDETPERRHAAYDLEAILPDTAGPLALRFAHDVLKDLSFAPGIPWDVSHVLAVTDPLRRPLGEGVVRIGQDVEVTLPRPTPQGLPAGSATGSPPIEPRVPDNAGPSPGASVAGFVGFLRHGLHHVASGYDHLLFLAALTLAARTWTRLAAIIGVFTVAHSLTVTLSALGWFSLPSWIVEPVIAGSIVVVGLQNLLAPGQATGHGRLVVAFGFGLVHGLGFAGGLADALGGATGTALAVPILAFCLGVELAHLAVGGPMFGLLQAFERRAGNASQPPGHAHPLPSRLRRLGSLLVSMGGAWFLWAALRNA